MHMCQRNDLAGVDCATAIMLGAGRGGVVQPFSYRYTADQSTEDLTPKGRFDLLNRSHELLACGNWPRVELMALVHALHAGEHRRVQPLALSRPWQSRHLLDYPNYGIVQCGVFGMARQQLADRLKLIAGARHNRHAYDCIHREVNTQGLPTSN